MSSLNLSKETLDVKRVCIYAKVFTSCTSVEVRDFVFQCMGIEERERGETGRFKNSKECGRSNTK